MNETKKISFNKSRQLDSYLREMFVLAKHAPYASAISSLEQVEEERARALPLEQKASYNFEIDFRDRAASRFGAYIERLYEKNQSPIYIWTARTNMCGLFAIESILEFNFTFNFDVNSEGIVVLLARNMADKMLLDFSSPLYNGAESRLEVEVKGDNWPLVTY